MKTEFTKKEKARVKELQERYDSLETAIEIQEKTLSLMRRERNTVFSKFCRIINPDPLPFDRKLLPYGWDR